MTSTLLTPLRANALAVGLADWSWPIDGWIIVVGALCGAACALVGVFLVLRQMSMMGDAISHAVLPGLVIAFLLSGSRDSLAMFVGAVVLGVLTALFTEWVRRFGKVDEGASMGVVFTTLFALGLVLIVQKVDGTDLDPACVLYGALEDAPFNTVDVMGLAIPQAALNLGVALLANLLVVTLLYKELKLSSFDPALATTLGIPAQLMHILLMALVAVTCVASFESVGNILVVAMLIVPAAAAHMLTDRLWLTLLLAVLIGVASAVLGHVGAITLPPLLGHPHATQTSGMMALASGLLFALAALLGPRHGALGRLLRRLKPAEPTQPR